MLAISALFIEKQADMANKVGAGFILQMDSNAHIGKDVIKNDVNEQNVNGKLYVQFLERMPNLTVNNSLPICEGSITKGGRRHEEQNKVFLMSLLLVKRFCHISRG